MQEANDSRDPLVAHRELESITTKLLSACEKGHLDAVLAEIGRRQEVQKVLTEFSTDEIDKVKDDILAILARVQELDAKIEPALTEMMDSVGAKVRSVSTSRKLIDSYIKESMGNDAKYFDKQG